MFCSAVPSDPHLVKCCRQVLLMLRAKSRSHSLRPAGPARAKNPVRKTRHKAQTAPMKARLDKQGLRLAITIVPNRCQFSILQFFGMGRSSLHGRYTYLCVPVCICICVWHGHQDTTCMLHGTVRNPVRQKHRGVRGARRGG